MSASYDGAWTEKRSLDSIDQARVSSRAVGRAKQRLVNAHRAEYDKYFEEERKNLHLPEIKKRMRRTHPKGRPCSSA